MPDLAPRKLPLGEEEHLWLAKTFRRLDFFSGMTLGQLELILPNVERRGYPDGAPVIMEGTEPQAVHIIYRGQAVVKRKLRFWARPEEVTRLGAGEHFGEMAVLDRRLHRSRVEAAGGLETFAVPAQQFRYVLERNPGLVDRLREIMAVRLESERRFREGREA